MSERVWFHAAGGEQQGPYGEAQFRDLIARGTVTAETLVWTQGMDNWQTAGDVPGLLSGIPQMIGRSASAVMRGGPLSIDFGILDFTWRSILVVLSFLLVVPAPWAIVWYVKWMVSRVHVPGRPNLSFTGRALTVAAWYFGALILAICIALIGVRWLDNLTTLVQLALYWLFLRWFVANIASNGQPLGLSFSGSLWAYLGWNILGVISVITIVGWAWVFTAQIRWACRNIQGTRRQVVFKGTGLEYLWRVIVVVIASIFIIPIPWVFRWMLQWQLSQTVLVERAA